MSDSAAEHGLTPQLTPRELEVLRLFRAGRGVSEIANELVISPWTARRHLTKIMAKLDFQA